MPIFINPILKLSYNSDFLAYLENGEYSDLELEVKEGKVKKTFNVHRVILARNSDFFSKLLGGPFKEKKANKVTIEADIGNFETFLKLIYGEKTILPTTAQSLQFLQSLDYFGLGVDIEKFIKQFDVPKKEDFLSYMEKLRNLYPDDKSFSKSIISTLQHYIDFYDNDEDRFPFFSSFWSLLPKNLQKNNDYYLRDDEEQ